MTSQEALQFMESRLDVNKLISEIQNRPALWDMTQKDYRDRVKRKQCWEEITELFVGSDMTLDEKKNIGDILHKKWKNIRDRFARDIQERKGKSGEGARKKVPYMYSQQLQFLRDTVAPKRTVNSLDRTSAESTSLQEEREEEEEDEDEEKASQLEEAKPTSSAPNILRARVRQLGKKRLHPVEERILRSLDRYDKRANMTTAKEKDDDNDNRHFLLSLVPSLAALPRPLNTCCRIEIMQCINKYETMSQQHQQLSTVYLPTTQSYPTHQQYNQHQTQSQQSQQPHQFQPARHAQVYIPNQLESSSSSCITVLPSESQQHPPRTFVTPRPTPSPADSPASYISNFSNESDS